jgi:hypothetical protein
MVLTPPPGMLKRIVSAPAVSLASCIAALSVHWLPREALASQTLSARLRSTPSPVLFTVKAAA